ncbi:MAG: hypothetical protein MUP66_02955 [Candidatus Nanohaloarchaeota archaeon QJJ-5]|nr:hypothetical protein [Candidatus Nanohaloarchaeota archaeon QJJ-5]
MMADKLARAFTLMGYILLVLFPLAGVITLFEGIAMGDIGRSIYGLSLTLAFSGGAFLLYGSKYYRRLRHYRSLDPADRTSEVWEGRVMQDDEPVTTVIDQETVPGCVFRVSKRRKKEVASTMGEAINAHDAVWIETRNGMIELPVTIEGDLFDPLVETASNSIILQDDIPLFEVSGDSDPGQYDDPVDRRTASFINEVFGTQQQGALSGVTTLILKEQPLQAGEQVHIIGSMQRSSNGNWKPDGSVDLRRGTVGAHRERLKEKWDWAWRKGAPLLVVGILVGLIG